jgi:hypothetical protein
MKRERLIVCAAVLALLAGFSPNNSGGSGEEPAKARAAEPISLPGPPARALRILQAASRVEAFRIKPRQEKAAARQIAGYPILASSGKEQGEAFAAALVKVLSDEKTWKGNSARCFNPGVAFRAHGDKESVDIIICFACTNFRLYVNDATGKPVIQSSGAFGPRIAPLLGLAKRAFPDDKEIQGLREKCGAK